MSFARVRVTCITLLNVWLCRLTKLNSHFDALQVPEKLLTNPECCHIICWWLRVLVNKKVLNCTPDCIYKQYVIFVDFSPWQMYTLDVRFEALTGVHMRSSLLPEYSATSLDDWCLTFWDSVDTSSEVDCHCTVLKWWVTTRWFKYDRDWFVCKQAALRSSCATLREWSHNLHPPSCSG